MTRRGASWFGALALGALGATGCMASSIGADVARVRGLADVTTLAQVADADVDSAPDQDARRILAQPLDADAAVRVALLNNRELRATLREMGIARGHVIQAGLLPNPVVEAELLPERNTQLELRVEYDITEALLAPRRARTAAPDLQATRYRAAAAVVELGYRVREAFYRAQSAEQRLALAQQVLDGFAAGRDAARALLAAGNIPELSLVHHEAAYEHARVTVAQLELEVAVQRERVQRLLGAHGPLTNWRVRGPLALAPERVEVPDRLEARALSASLELIEMRYRLDGVDRQGSLARAEGWIPDVTLDVHALQGNPEDSPPLVSDQDWRFGGGVGVAVPLFDRNQGKARALDAEFDALSERYFGAATDLRSLARETRSRLQSAHTRAWQYQDVIVPAQRRVTEQTLLQYNAMQVGVFELLEARRRELDAELASVETLREFWTATAALDALLAGRSVTGAAAETGSPRMSSAATERH